VWVIVIVRCFSVIEKRPWIQSSIAACLPLFRLGNLVPFSFPYFV
jgi:hypothetical protein